MQLNWPDETVLPGDWIEPWYQAASNRVLDFHGDPVEARLVVFQTATTTWRCAMP
jgi:hypothetical protein